MIIVCSATALQLMWPFDKSQEHDVMILGRQLSLVRNQPCALYIRGLLVDTQRLFQSNKRLYVYRRYLHLHFTSKYGQDSRDNTDGLIGLMVNPKQFIISQIIAELTRIQFRSCWSFLVHEQWQITDRIPVKIRTNMWKFTKMYQMKLHEHATLPVPFTTECGCGSTAKTSSVSG